MSVAELVAQLKLMSSPPTEAEKAALNTAINSVASLRNKTNPILDLSSQTLSIIDIQNLCEALKTNTTVKRLALHSLEVPPLYQALDLEAIKALADLLKHNSTLTFLGLSFSNVTDLGAHLLFNALNENTSSALETLTLDGNHLQFSMLVEDGLSKTKLKRVSLKECTFDKNGPKRIDAVLRLSLPTLEEINLNCAVFPKSGLTSEQIAKIAENIKPMRYHPVRSPNFFGTQLGAQPAFRDALLAHAAHAPQREEYARSIGKTVGALLPDSLAQIVGEYADLSADVYEAGIKENTFLLDPEAIPPKAIEAAPPEAADTTPVSMPLPTPGSPGYSKKMLATTILVLSIAALITLSALTLPILAIVLAAITAVSVAGIIAYNKLSKEKTKSVIQQQDIPNTNVVLSTPPSATALKPAEPNLRSTPSLIADPNTDSDINKTSVPNRKKMD